MQEATRSVALEQVFGASDEKQMLPVPCIDSRLGSVFLLRDILVANEPAARMTRNRSGSSVMLKSRALDESANRDMTTTSSVIRVDRSRS